VFSLAKEKNILTQDEEDLEYKFDFNSAAYDFISVV
jgi:hypothetical protein